MSDAKSYLPPYAHDFANQYKQYTPNASVSEKVAQIVHAADIRSFQSPFARELRIALSTKFLTSVFPHATSTDEFAASLASLVGVDIFRFANANASPKKYLPFFSMLQRIVTYDCTNRYNGNAFLLVHGIIGQDPPSLYKLDQSRLDEITQNMYYLNGTGNCADYKNDKLLDNTKQDSPVYSVMIENILNSAMLYNTETIEGSGLVTPAHSNEILLLPMKTNLKLTRENIVVHPATGDGNCFYHALSFQLLLLDENFFTANNELVSHYYKATPVIDRTKYARMLREVVFTSALHLVNVSKPDTIRKHFYVTGDFPKIEKEIDQKLSLFNSTNGTDLQLSDIFKLYAACMPKYNISKTKDLLSSNFNSKASLSLQYDTHTDFGHIQMEIVDILILVRQHIENRITNMSRDTEWVEARNIGFISFVLGVNITLLSMKEQISNERIESANYYVVLNEQPFFDKLPHTIQGGRYNCYLILSGRGRLDARNHFDSITFKDENITYIQGKTVRPGCLHVTNQDMIKYSRRFNDYNPVSPKLKLHMYSYAYMRNVHAQEVFAFVFYSVLTMAPAESCILTRVRYLHKLIVDINGAFAVKKNPTDLTGKFIVDENDMTAAMKKRYKLVTLPLVLGFGRDDKSPEQTGARYMLLRTETTDDTSSPYNLLHALISSVSYDVLNAMYTSACLVVLFMLSPPVDQPDGDALNYCQDMEYLTNIFHNFHRSFTGKVFPQDANSEGKPITHYIDVNHYVKFIQKAWTRSPVLTSANIDDVMNTVVNGLLTMPEEINNTAFFEFFSVCLSTILYDELDVPGNKITGNIQLISAPMTLPSTAVEFNMPQKNDTAIKTLTIDVKIDNAFDPQSGPANSKLFSDMLANDSVELVVWFTQINPSQAIDMEVYHDTSKPFHDSPQSAFDEYEKQQLGMQHFRDGSKTTFGKIVLDKNARGKGSNATITVPFSQFDLEKLASTKQTCYLHFAMMVSEKPDSVDLAPRMVRRGHSFVDIGKLDVERPFVVRLWEGPIDPSLSMTRTSTGQYQFAKTFAYEQTFDIAVTIHDPMGLFRPSPGISKPDRFTMTEPNRMFDDADMVHMAQYMYAMNTKLTQTQLAMHSLLYVNMPMTRNVVPLFAVSFLPPLEVLPCVLESRAKLVLDHENITATDFLQIALVAFLGSLLTPEDVTAWGFDTKHFAGHEVFRAFARDRFLWIFTQIVNPFNKMRYAFDKFNRVDNEQMGMPGEDVGDCEDFAEAAMRFCKSLILNFDPQTYRISNPVVYVVLTFLRMYTPCTSVLTTDGAALKTVKQDNPAMGLHMLAILVLKTTIDPSLGANVHKLQRIVPLEGTGLQFNSYRTVDSCFGAEKDPAVCRDIERIKESINRYSGVVDLAYSRIKDVKNEVIVFPMMINREKTTYKAPGSGYTQWEFIYPSHYFYDNFVSLCHDQAGVASRFLDFGVINPATPRQRYGVPFYMAIMPDNDDKWKLEAIALPSASMANLHDICQRFADNVMPASALTLPTKHIRCDSASKPKIDTTAPVNSFVVALLVKSVNFYINTKARPNGRTLIEKVKVFFADAIANNNPAVKNTSIHGVDTIFTLNLNTNYLMIQVHLD